MSTDKLPSPLDKLPTSSRTPREIAEGQTLFVQANATKGFYYLVDGIIDLKRVTCSGHSITIHRARSGDTFAEASLFSDTYHCTATAFCDSTVIECERSAILQLLEKDKEFSRLMISRFATQIQESRRRVELLSIRSADERVLAAFEDGLLVDEISNFAESIGLAPETVYRTLAQLNKDGRITKTSRGQYRLNA